MPFFSVAGSSFVEMFAGVGAAWVRDRFSEARNRAPAIIVIDEMDMTGHRRSGWGAVIADGVPALVERPPSWRCIAEASSSAPSAT